MAVVVQRQLAPDLCFVLHTRHPGGLGGLSAVPLLQRGGALVRPKTNIQPSPTRPAPPPLLQ